jgi:hypothetical protein
MTSREHWQVLPDAPITLQTLNLAIVDALYRFERCVLL